MKNKNSDNNKLINLFIEDYKTRENIKYSDIINDKGEFIYTFILDEKGFKDLYPFLN